MTNQNYFIVGKLGKPHSLKGFQYINIEYFFRDFDLKEITLQIEGVNFVVDLLDTFLNENKLPWPGFFIGQELNNNYKLLSYEVLNNIYFLKISGIEMSVPYNSNFFIYENDNLTLLDSSLTI